MRRNLAIAALALSACAPALQLPPEDPTRIDYDRRPPSDWPTLEVLTTVLATREELERSCPGAAARSRAFGCARFNFCERRCSIYLLHTTDQIRHEHRWSHEHAHCQGFDHPGASSVAEAWAIAKNRGCFGR